MFYAVQCLYKIGGGLMVEVGISGDECAFRKLRYGTHGRYTPYVFRGCISH